MITANTLGIGVAIKLRDDFTNRANAVNQSFTNLYGNSQRVLRANLTLARQFGVGMTAAGTVATRGLMNAVKVAGDFEFIMRTIQGVTSESNTNIARMSNLALKLGTETIYTADEVASAMEHMVRSGYKFEDAMKSIRGVVYLGAAGGGKTISGKGGIGDYMAAIMQEFNLAPGASGKVADMIAKAANISSSDIDDLAQALKYSAGSAKILNVELPETLSMLAVLSNSGLRGGVAGRSLNNMMIYLATSLGKFKSKRQADAFKEIGLGVDQVVDSTGNLRPMGVILDAFSQKLKKMPKVEQLSALNALFNIRGQRAMIPLMEKSLQIGYNYEESLKQIRDYSGDYAKNISGVMMDSIKGDAMVLADTWKTLKIEAGTTLGIVFRPMAQILSSILNGAIAFSKTPFGKATVLLGAGLALATTAAGAFLVVATSIKLLTWGSTATFANMGRTLVWAWNSAAGAALRYATTAKGAMLVSTPTGARWRSLTTGKFVKAGAGGAAGSAATGMGGGFLSKILPTLGTGISRVSSLFLKLGGPLSLVVGFASAFGALKPMLTILKYVLGTFIQSIMFVADFIANLGEGPVDAFNIAKSKFKKRQDILKGTISSEKNEIPKGVQRGVGVINAPSINPLVRPITVNPKTTKLQLTIDGKAVGDAVMKDPYEELRNLLQSKTN